MGETETLATEDNEAASIQIERLFTLGPEGTNCEFAARYWFRRRYARGDVTLLPTLEDAVEQVVAVPRSALLSCIVYPELHNLVFRNLTRLHLVDSFVMRMHKMVLATKTQGSIESIVSHPAPEALIPRDIPARSFARSNSEAGALCASGQFDACITTHVVAERYGLLIQRDFGSIPMGFAIHAPPPEVKAR